MSEAQSQYERIKNVYAGKDYSKQFEIYSNVSKNNAVCAFNYSLFNLANSAGYITSVLSAAAKTDIFELCENDQIEEFAKLLNATIGICEQMNKLLADGDTFKLKDEPRFAANFCENGRISLIYISLYTLYRDAKKCRDLLHGCAPLINMAVDARNKKAFAQFLQTVDHFCNDMLAMLNGSEAEEEPAQQTLIDF